MHVTYTQKIKTPPALFSTIDLQLPWGKGVAHDLFISSFHSIVLQALNTLTPDILICIFRDFREPPTPLEKVQTLECLAPDENVIVFVSRWTWCQGQKRW